MLICMGPKCQTSAGCQCGPLRELAAEIGSDAVLRDAAKGLLDLLREYSGWDGTVQFRALESALALPNKARESQPDTK